MRNTVINQLFEYTSKNPNVYLLTGDLWYSVVDEFALKLPNQFINVWIAEQNMIGIAVGLALTWKKVFCFSIIPFVTMRCYEQIRVDVCYQNVDVNLIWVWWWFAYGTAWSTHYGIEDINVMRWLPNMKILAPADKIEAKKCMKYILDNKGPFYMRLNKWGETDIHIDDLTEKDISKPIEVQPGTEILIIVTGNILQSAKIIVENLKENWISVQLLSIPMIKPIGSKYILECVKWKKAVFTIEEHTIIGWLGSTIAEILAENKIGITFKRFGINDSFPVLVGDQEYMRDQNGLDKNIIIDNILKITK